MNNANARPKWVNDLIAEFGRLLGFDDLGFDDADSIEFEFDGIPLAVTHPPQGTALILRAPLPLSLSAPPAPYLLATLHAANMDSLKAGKGIVACDLGLGTWVWADRIAIDGLTALHLRDRIETAVNAASFWRSETARLALHKSETAAEDAPSTNDVVFRL